MNLTEIKKLCEANDFESGYQFAEIVPELVEWVERAKSVFEEILKHNGCDLARGYDDGCPTCRKVWPLILELEV